jgi:hypothetical protein
MTMTELHNIWHQWQMGWNDTESRPRYSSAYASVREGELGGTIIRGNY